MLHSQPSSDTGRAGVLEHLTGPARGQVSWLTQDVLHAWVDETRRFKMSGDRSAFPGPVAASLHWDGQHHTITTGAGQAIWVNRRKVPFARLRSGDVIEFGEAGPISRYRLVENRHLMRWSIDDMVSDTIAYLRSSRRPLGRRIVWAAGDFGRRLTWETTIAFRAVVVMALLVLGIVAYTQYRATSDLEQTLQQEAIQLQGISADLMRARREALQPSDLRTLREEMSERVSATIERLEVLESEAGATPRVIARSHASVVFLQGAYGLRHRETGAMLRHVLGPEGVPILSPLGRPLLSLDGEGPVAEIQFTGSAFLLRDSRLLVSNRHVALPWESGTDPERLAAQKLEPSLLRFIGYFPGMEKAIDVRVHSISDVADLVTLALDEAPAGVEGLSLADDTPASGAEVIVMGYPTGLRSMLAQSGAAFLSELQETGDADFWSVARRLSQSGLIAPLASRGIVSQVTGQAILYDAETTHGGSGGPVLDKAGRVVAVNAAILPDFGGSNLGVPVDKLRALIADDAVKIAD